MILSSDSVNVLNVNDIMKEDFLHYLWRFKQIDFNNLKTTHGLKIEVINFGTYTQLQGPDFFNALIKIDGQLWAGNVEMHVKASDWYIHHHEIDENYKNVILHVVWENDIEIFNAANQKIPILVLKNYVDVTLRKKYKNLIKSKYLINCNNQINQVPQYIISSWKERLFLERLENKTIFIEEIKQQTNSNWQQITFITLAKTFGLNTNGSLFKQMAQEIPYHILPKISSNLVSLEALFFGVLQLIPTEAVTAYELELKNEYQYLKHKFKLDITLNAPEFYKHRPDNFPTIRLAQLAYLLHKHKNIFSLITEAKSLDDFYAIFQVQTSQYWNHHYTFNSESAFKIKKTSKNFINLLLINAIIPLLYVYNKAMNKENIDELIYFMEFLPPENNNTTKIFNKLQFPISSAFDSQVVLHLKKNYCDLNKCLNCAIGKNLLN